MTSFRLAILGAGVMGEAVATNALRSGLLQPGDLVLVEAHRERRDEVTSRLGVGAAEVREALAGAQAAVLAVKPQEFPTLAKQTGAAIPEGCIVISIMAGVPLVRLREALGHARVVRAMPNTPAQIGAGVTVWTAATEVDTGARDRIVRPLLAALGEEYEVDSERYIDMATAVNGSGPAYVFLVIEAMIDAAVQVGLRRDLATNLVLGTVSGAARFAKASGKHPAELRNMVTSPGGTTAAGLFELESAALRAAFARAVRAAHEQAKTLGG